LLKYLKIELDLKTMKFENNYVGNSSILSNAEKNFDILAP